MQSRLSGEAGLYEDPQITELVEDDCISLTGDEIRAVNTKEVGEELGELKKIPIEKATAAGLSSAKLAAVLAAYLVDYDVEMKVTFHMNISRF